MAVEVKRGEVYRYLGYGRSKVDDATKQMVEECITELERVAKPRVVCQEYPLSISTEGLVDGGCFQTESRNLRKNLGGCGRVLLMAATLGIDADRLLKRYEKIRMSKAIVMQAAAAAMIEAYCDAWCEDWKEEYERRGLYLRPRYSPGYGDFSLNCQRALLDGVGAGAKLGIELTEGDLMVPTKSVTAVIGISESAQDCVIHGCENCEHVMCPYRRG